MAEFAVIGLGRFGRAVARSLSQEGQAVLAIDRDPDRLQMVSEIVDAIAVIDATSESAVADLRLSRMAGVVVAMGPRATEASILTTALLKQYGVERIIARALDEAHARILLAIGASEIVNPEDEMGYQLAGHLSHPGVVSQMDLGSDRLALVEAPESLVGRTMKSLEIRSGLGLRLVAVFREGQITVGPDAEFEMQSGDRLLLLGPRGYLHRLAGLK